MGIASALISSLQDKPIDSKTVFIGEIGLTGEVRPVSAIEQRISEIQKLGFTKIILPKANKITKQYDVDIYTVEKIREAMFEIFKFK